MGELKNVNKTLAAFVDARIAVYAHNFPRLYVDQPGLLKMCCACSTIHQTYHFATPHLCWYNNTSVQQLHCFSVFTITNYLAIAVKYL